MTAKSPAVPTKKQYEVYTKNLEQEIIQNVAKTMQKKYVKKAEPRRQAKIR